MLSNECGKKKLFVKNPNKEVRKLLELENLSSKIFMFKG